MEHTDRYESLHLEDNLGHGPSLRYYRLLEEVFLMKLSDLSEDYVVFK